MTWACEIEYRCRTKQRPRMNPRTGRAHMPTWYQGAKHALAWQVTKHRPPFAATGDVHLRLEICVKGKGRGDDDNLIGFVMDALEGVLYANDRQCHLYALRDDGKLITRNYGADLIRLQLK